MMKKLFCLFAALALVVNVAFAAEPAFKKENLEFGGEYGYSNKAIEDIGLGLGGYNLVQKTSNVKTWNFLVTVGYKLSDLLTPYLVVGDSFLNLDQDIQLNSTSLLTTQFRGGSGILVGGGAKGTLVKFNNGILLGYDTRWTTFNTSTTDRQADVLGYAIDNKMKASLGEYVFDMTVSKYYDLTETCTDGTVRKKFGVEGIKPFIGGRWTHSDLVVKNAISGGINLSTESELQGNMLSAIGGATVQVNKNWSASVGGIVGQENGVQVKVGYKF